MRFCELFFAGPTIVTYGGFFFRFCGLFRYWYRRWARPGALGWKLRVTVWQSLIVTMFEGLFCILHTFRISIYHFFCYNTFGLSLPLLAIACCCKLAWPSKHAIVKTCVGFTVSRSRGDRNCIMTTRSKATSLNYLQLAHCTCVK